MNLWTKALRKIRMPEQTDVKSLKEKPDSYFQNGKNVRVINNLKYVKSVESKFGGGWTDEMEQCLNQICTVIKVDPDKLIQVKTVSGKLWLFKRESLESVDCEDDDTLVFTVPSKPINQADLFKAIDEGTLIDLNPNIPINILNKKNREGMTSLFYACFIGKNDIALWLCDKGADPKIPDNSGDLPIHNCALNRNHQLLKDLIGRYPSTANATRRNGKTVLDIAIDLADKTIENMIKTNRDKSLSTTEIIPEPPVTLNSPFSQPHKSIKEVYSFNSETLKMSNPPDDNSTTEIIPEPPLTLNQQLSQPHKSIKEVYSFNSETLKMSNPPDDNSLKIFEVLTFENVNKKQLPSESISYTTEIIPDPPRTLNPPKKSIIQSRKPPIGDGTNNSGSLNLPYPPEDDNLKIFENLKFENINKKQSPSESISCNQKISDGSLHIPSKK